MTDLPSLIVNILVGVLLGYAAVVVVLYLTQASIVYQPRREIGRTPSNIGLPFESFTVTAPDGIPIAGWYVPHPAPRATVLFCHGNNGNIAEELDTISVLHGLGLAVTVFDYRGYGESGGTPTEEGTYRDAEAVREWLASEKGAPLGEVILHGRSLGGAVAAKLAADEPPKLLILEAPFTSIADMGHLHYPWLPVRALKRFHYDTLACVARVTCPVLVIHSPEDTVVPIRLGRRVYDAAREPKAFLEITGRHRDGFLTSGEVYRAGVDGFLRKCIGI